MKKLLIGITLALLLVLTGCAKKADEVELQNTEQLSEGLAQTQTSTKFLSNLASSSQKPLPGAPPSGWYGPDTFVSIPEGTQTLYYHFSTRLDSAGALIDSLQWLLMFTPDIWGGDTGYVTGIDFWLWRKTESDIWWHFNLTIPDTAHISGAMKWHYQSTWLNYAYTVSTDTMVTKAAVFDVTTSDDIRLSANFTFNDPDGAGTGWGKFQDIEFVRWIFYAEPDPDGYEGYYTLLSQDWKVKHFFPEQPEAN